MNNFKTITFLFFITATLIFSATASANGPQLFMYNNKEKDVVAEKSEDLEKYEINNKDLIALNSFQTKKQTKKILAGQKIFFPPKNS